MRSGNGGIHQYAITAQFHCNCGITGSTDTGIDQSTYKDVKSYIFTPIVVTKDNVADTVIADKFYEASEICTGEYAQACTEAGVS